MRMFDRKFNTPEEKAAYFHGLRDAIYAYAWWKDGEMQVGSCGTKYKDAISRVNKLESE
jgi:hypothetical protein